MDALYHEEVARLAYRFWEDRGLPFGSPEVDWRRAELELWNPGQQGVSHDELRAGGANWRFPLG